MTNPLTMQVESRMGAVFVSLMAMFFTGILFIALNNYNSDQIVLNASVTQIRTISSTERQLIAQWIEGNNIVVPPGKGYHYIEQQYPDKPWLNY